MKTTVEYLDATKARLGLESDYAAAKALGVTRAAVSRYRTGTGTFDDLTAARVAEILGVEPIEVIAAVNYERTKDVRGRAVWESIWGKAAGAIALNLIVCAVGVSVAPTSKAAASGENQAQSATLYIMSNRRRFRRETQLLGLKLAA
jgi:predicted transcriptional regulator